MEISAEPTGIYVEAAAALYKIPEFDKRAADHYWVIAALWKWTPGNAKGSLDHENLVRLDKPFCYYCEQPFSRLLEKRKCPGKPLT